MHLKTHMALASVVPAIRYTQYQTMTTHLDELSDIFSCKMQTLKQLSLSMQQSQSLQHINWQQVEAHYRRIQSDNDLHVLTVACAQYPAQLREISTPPLMLYIKGRPTLLKLPQIALVGSRNASEMGVAISKQLAEQLTCHGLTITSGAAYGIDAAAHEGALREGPTIAVLGCGVDKVYPAAHAALLKKIQHQGAIVSELPLGSPPRRAFFPRRNRIISGLSYAVVVIESAIKSGSLITARYALEQNREVFAVPGSVRSPLSAGCHALIKQGAQLVETVEDILYALPAHLREQLKDTKKSPTEQARLDTQSRRVLNSVDYHLTCVDDIIISTGLSAPVVIPILTLLVNTRYVERVPGGYVKLHKDNS